MVRFVVPYHRNYCNFLWGLGAVRSVHDPRTPATWEGSITPLSTSLPLGPRFFLSFSHRHMTLPQFRWAHVQMEYSYNSWCRVRPVSAARLEWEAVLWRVSRPTDMLGKRCWPDPSSPEPGRKPCSKSSRCSRWCFWETVSASSGPLDHRENRWTQQCTRRRRRCFDPQCWNVCPPLGGWDALRSAGCYPVPPLSGRFITQWSIDTICYKPWV